MPKGIYTRTPEIRKKMSDVHKSRWKKLALHIRSQKMSEISRIRHSKMTQEQKKELGQFLKEALKKSRLST